MKDLSYIRGACLPLYPASHKRHRKAKFVHVWLLTNITKFGNLANLRELPHSPVRVTLAFNLVD
jgi:hypothetical protein